MMSREDISRKIQSNQRVDDSTRAWCESLANEIYASMNFKTDLPFNDEFLPKVKDGTKTLDIRNEPVVLGIY